MSQANGPMIQQMISNAYAQLPPYLLQATQYRDPIHDRSKSAESKALVSSVDQLSSDI